MNRDKSPLKTLRELSSDMAQNRYSKKPVVYVSNLRQEVIKQVRELESKTEMSMEFAVIFGIKPFQLEILNRNWKAEKKFTVGWIKHFFNIKEEE